MSNVKDFSFTHIKEKIILLKNNNQILNLFFNSDNPSSKQKSGFENFVQKQIKNLDKQGVESITEFIGKLLLWNPKHNSWVGIKSCYSTEQGAEGFAYDFLERNLYVYEAKSTDVVNNSEKSAHQKIILAVDDIKKFGNSRTKLQHSNQVQQTIPKTEFKNGKLSGTDVEKLIKDLKSIDDGKPNNAFIAAHYSTIKDDCEKTVHKNFPNQHNYTFNLNSKEITEIFSIMGEKKYE